MNKILFILLILIAFQAECFGQSAEEYFKRGVKKLEIGDYMNLPPIYGQKWGINKIESS